MQSELAKLSGHEILWSHQREGALRAADLWDFAFFFEQGTGKSLTTITTIRLLCARQKRVLKTLIISPVSVCINWKREIEKFSKLGPHAHVLQGSEKKRLHDFETVPAKIFITNYEALQMKELVAAFKTWWPDIIVWDESQRLKNPAAKRTKQAIQLSDLARHRFILSGTPILNSAMDIFSQFRCLDKGQTFGENFYIFRAKWFEDKNAGMPSFKHFPDWRPRKGMEEAFNSLIYKKAMRVLKSECLDLPPLVRQEIFVEMSSVQRKHYEEMKRDFITYVKDSACTATIAMTKALRLQQIATGFIQLADGDRAQVSLTDNPRAKALEELLEDLTPNHKVIVWAVFRENYAQIRAVCEKLGIKFSELTGETSAADRQKNIDAFQNDPTVRVFLSSQAAGGVGITLTAASYSIFYSKGFSLEQDLQAEARNHRGGSEIHQKVTRIDLVAYDSIDQTINDALSRKMNIAESILTLAESKL